MKSREGECMSRGVVMENEMKRKGNNGGNVLGWCEVIIGGNEKGTSLY